MKSRDLNAITMAFMVAHCGHPTERHQRVIDDRSGLASMEKQSIFESDEERAGLGAKGSRSQKVGVKETKTVDLEGSVVLIQVTVPYCRNDPQNSSQLTVTKYCSGTVISNRHILTAAHCFATECLSKNKLAMSAIKIPAEPPLPKVDMNSYNWTQSTLSPVNMAFVGGQRPGWSVGRTELRQILNPNDATGKSQFDVILTTVDQAVLDFGDMVNPEPLKAFQKAQYKESTQNPQPDLAQWRNSATSSDGSNFSFSPAGYGTPNGRFLVRSLREAMGVSKARYSNIVATNLDTNNPDAKDSNLYLQPNASTLNEDANDRKRLNKQEKNASINACKSDNDSAKSYEMRDSRCEVLFSKVAGCYGDSGGPLFFKTNGSSGEPIIIGVASVKTPPKLSPKDDPDPGVLLDRGTNSLECSNNDTVSYSVVMPDQVDAAMTSIAAQASPPKEVTVDFDLWNPNPPGDATGKENASRFIASLVAPHPVTPSTNVAPSKSITTNGWAQIIDPTDTTNKKVIPAYSAGGVLNAIASGGKGARSATWTATGLQGGQYQVEIFYLTETKNSNCVAVQYKTNGQTVYSDIASILDQKTGLLKILYRTVAPKTFNNVTRLATTTIGTFTKAFTNLTPEESAYIPVPKTADNSGTLSIRISDSPVSADPNGKTCISGGRIIADTIRLTWKKE